ncbi:hypothetical protein ACRXB1_37620, partial [Caballeronia sp. M23-90]
LDRIDHAIAQLPPDTPLADASWGARNRAVIGHPFARLVPSWLQDGVADWRAFMLDRIDHAIAQLPPDTPLADASWGARNRAVIGHPFARLVPSWL